MRGGKGGKGFKKGYKKRGGGLMKGAKSAWSMAKTALKVAGAVRNLINVEKKTLDVHAAVAGGLEYVQAAGQPVYLTNVVQGAAETQRIGNSIKLRNLFMRYMINYNPASGTANSICRIIVVKDLNRNVTNLGLANQLPTLANVLKPNVAGTLVDNICAPLNDSTSGRYKVICDKVFTLSANQPTYYFKKYWMINEDIKFPADSQNFSLDGYYAWFVTDQSANAPQVTGNSRIQFIDN